MKHTIFTFILCLTAATPPALGGEPKLINKKRVFPKGETSSKRPRRNNLWAIRLSPDGRKLLYPRAKGQPPLTPEGGPDWSKVKYEMVLRDLTGGKETVLPISPVPSGWETVFTRLNMFDPSGTRLVLANINVHRHKSGRGVEAVRTSMKIALYDIPTGKLNFPALEGPGVMAKFDRTGKGLIVARRSASGLALSTAALPELDPKPLKAAGYLHSVCPTADVICVWAPPQRTPRTNPRQRPQRGPQRLFLYDLKADRKIADLPVNKHNRNLDDWETQWTADGRYLYYHDVREVTPETPEGTRARTKPIARIWDCTANKSSGWILDAIPVGPGPTPTAMVLAKRTDAGVGGFLLHDAKSGREYPLGDSTMKLVHAWGGKVLYVKRSPEGADFLYLAEIALGANRRK